MLQPAKPYLENFAEMISIRPGPIPWSVSFDSGKPGPHVVVTGVIHGNETGSLPAIVKFVQKLQLNQIDFVGRMSFVLGNIPAFLKNERYLEADLNRVFNQDAPDTAERRRAIEISPFLETADLFIDLHQTSMPCLHSFYIFAFEEKSYLWARALAGAKTLVTRSQKDSFSKGDLCIDEYARHKGIPSVTIELGQKGITPEAECIATYILENIAHIQKQIALGQTTLEQAAEAQPELDFLTIHFREPFTDKKATLEPGFINMQPVRKDQYMGRSPSKSFSTPDAGYLLFPKYPRRDESGVCIDPMVGELYMLLTRLPKHPRDLY